MFFSTMVFPSYLSGKSFSFFRSGLSSPPAGACEVKFRKTSPIRKILIFIIAPLALEYQPQTKRSWNAPIRLLYVNVLTSILNTFLGRNFYNNRHLLRGHGPPQRFETLAAWIAHRQGDLLQDARQFLPRWFIGLGQETEQALGGQAF